MLCALCFVLLCFVFYALYFLFCILCMFIGINVFLVSTEEFENICIEYMHGQQFIIDLKIICFSLKI